MYPLVTNGNDHLGKLSYSCYGIRVECRSRAQRIQAKPNLMTSWIAQAIAYD